LKMAPCFLEIKRKVDTRIIKYRQKFERFSPELMNPACWRLGDDREGAALAAALHLYALRPAVQTIYLRQTFESPFANTLRLAFDSQLYALLPGQRFERALVDDPRHRCLGESQFIFEIKSDGRLPEWLRRGLEAAEVVQRALSKYVIAIEKLQLERAEIGVYA
jgi:VTC domain